MSKKNRIRTFKDRRKTACIIIEFEGLIRARCEYRHCSNAYVCAHSVYGRWIVATLQFFQPTLRYLIKTIKKLGVTIWRHRRCKYRRGILTNRVSAWSSTSNSSIYSSLALQLVNMRKDDEANDNNEPIIWLSVCISFFLFLALLCPLFSSLSLSSTLIKHREEKVDAGRGRWIFSSNSICISWTIHHWCAARSRSLQTWSMGKYRWMTIFFYFVSSIVSAHRLLNVSISHLIIFFLILMFVLYVRVRRYTLTVDDRREMGGDKASLTYINWPSRWIYEEKIRKKKREVHSFIQIMSWDRRSMFLPSTFAYSRLKKANLPCLTYICTRAQRV